MRPSIVSAGYVAHRPKTAERLPPAVAMFHTAGMRRSLLVIGSFTPVEGSNCTKSRMRCSSGLVPVIIVVQTSGESGGEIVFRRPPVPSAASFASAGMTPRAVY